MTHGAKLDEISKSFCIPIHPLQGSYPTLQKKGGRWSISSHILCRKRNHLVFCSQLESWCQFKSRWSLFLLLSKFLLSAAAFMKREYPFAPCYDLELFILRHNHRLNSKERFSTSPLSCCLIENGCPVGLGVILIQIRGQVAQGACVVNPNQFGRCKTLTGGAATRAFSVDNGEIYCAALLKQLPCNW